ESDNYNETGTGGGALAINSDDVSAFLISVGSDIEWNIAGKDGATYMPYLRAKYSYDAIADEVETSSSFLAGGTAFASKGADVAKSALTLGTGVNVITAAGFEFTAAYDAEIKEDFVAHSGVLQARWAF
ncbi:MAG: outer membrane autotransporter protein, partial [bacterium]